MSLASYIDHTLLKPTATRADIAQLCKEAKANHFAAVCIPPFYVDAAKKDLGASIVKTATVIGFPFGYSVIEAKQEEIRQAITDGADELDMVICLAALKSGEWDYLEKEIAAVMPIISTHKKSIKIIIESGILSDDEIIHCCQLYAKYQVQFLKTSTGYAEHGASVEAVKLMRKSLPETIGIKASGGIRTADFAKALIQAGATRLGCSAGVKIIKEENSY